MSEFEFNIGNNNAPQIKILHSGISFNAQVIELLNYPQYVSLGLNKQSKKLGIRAAKKEDKLAKVYPFVTDEKKKKHIILSASKMRGEILKLLDVNLDRNSIRFFVEWDSENNMAIISLDKPC